MRRPAYNLLSHVVQFAGVFCADEPSSGRHKKRTVNLSFLVKRGIRFVRELFEALAALRKAPKLFRKRVASSTTQGLPPVHQQSTDTPDIVPMALRRLGARPQRRGLAGDGSWRGITFQIAHDIGLVPVSNAVVGCLATRSPEHCDLLHQFCVFTASPDPPAP